MAARFHHLIAYVVARSPYPLMLQGLVSLILLTVPISALSVAVEGVSAMISSRFWMLAWLVGAYLLALWSVPVRVLPRWGQLLYLIGQSALVATVQMVMPSPMATYVYLMIVLQAIYLLRSWIWIPFAVGVGLLWNGSLLIASTSALEWLQQNLAIAFPATCMLIAAILYARQNRSNDQVQQLLQQFQQRYDGMLIALRDAQQQAALAERARLAQTINTEIRAALTSAEQGIAAAVGQAQTNLVRLQATIAQTRDAAGLAIEQLRTTIALLRSPEPAPAPPPASPAASAPLADLPAETRGARQGPRSADELLMSSRAIKVLSWVLPLIYVALAAPLALLSDRPAAPGFLWQFLLVCGILLAVYALTQRIRRPLLIQAGLAGQTAAVLALAILTQSVPLLLGLLLVLWQLALRLSAPQIVAFFAGLQASILLVMLRLVPSPAEFSANLMFVGVSSAVMVGLLWMARSQFNGRRLAEQGLVRLSKLAGELEQQMHEVRTLAAAAERTRLAREMHDDLGYQLVLLNVQLQVAEDLIDEDPAAALEHLRSTREQIRAAWHSLFAATADLHSLDGATLEAALRELARQGQLSTQARVELRVRGDLAPLPAAIVCTIYRAVQEGLTNACKYARAHHIDIVVAASGGIVEVCVRDDGQGLTTTDYLPIARGAAGQQHSGFGLVGLRERAALLGGSIDAGPLPGGGFGLFLTLPYGAGPAPVRGDDLQRVAYG